MNSLYIGAGVALILALVAALVGPLFVDWTAYRAYFETESSRLVGMNVRVLGDVDARLLPSPRIRFGDVVIGDLDRPLARIGRFELDLEAVALIRGEVRVAELGLDRPVVDLELGGDGRPVGGGAALGSGARLDEVALERVTITDGRLSFGDRRSGGRIAIDRITAAGSAEALAGRWRLEGEGRRGERDFGFRLSGSGGGGGGLVVRANVAPKDDPTILSAEVTARGGEAGPVYSGNATIERHGRADDEGPYASWRFGAAIEGDVRELRLREATLAVGPEERPLTLTGEGQIGLGSQPAFEARISAKQIDLDRAISGEGGRAVRPSEAAVGLLAALGSIGDAAVPGRVRLEVQSATIGGGAVQDLALEARPRPGGWAIDRFELRLPGRARVAANGRLDLGAEPQFAGRVEGAAEQPASLASWWRGEPVTIDGLDSLAVATDATLAPGEVRGDDFTLTIAGAATHGYFDWSAERGVKAALTGERLEFDRLATLYRSLRDAGAFDGAGGDAQPMALDLSAGTAIVADTRARDVAVRLGVAADRVDVERLEIGDLAGAKITGSGSIDHPTTLPEGRFDLVLAATDPTGLARLAAERFGAAGAEQIGVIAAAAAPLDVRLHLDGRRVDATASEVRLVVDGRAGAAKIAVDGRYHGRIDDPARAEVHLKGGLEGERLPAPVAALFGASAGATAGGFGLKLSAEGIAADGGLAVEAGLRLGSAAATAAGRVTSEPEAIRVDGRIEASAADLAAWTATAGRASADRRLPVTIAAKLGGTWPRLDLGEVAGRLGETRFEGGGTIDLSARPVVIEGRLGLDRIDGATLMGFGLGSGAVTVETSTGGGTWSGAVLDEPLIGRATTRLAVTIERIATAAGLDLDRARFDLATKPGEIRISGFGAGFAGGRLDGGEATIGRSGGSTRLAGKARLEAADLATLVWRSGGRAVASGRVGGEITVDGAGRSLAALAASLTGQGRLSFTGLGIVGFGAEALSAVATAVDGGVPNTEMDVGRVFAARIPTVETEIGTLDVPLTVEGGVVHSGRVVVETPTNRLVGRANLDLGRFGIDAELTVEPRGKAADGLKTVISKGLPSAGLKVQGPLARPVVRFDVASIVAYQTLRALERDIDRVETLEQDAMERARFARELRRLEEVHREERARREAETRRAAEAEAARQKAAAEAARAAQPPAPPPTPVPQPAATPQPAPQSAPSAASAPAPAAATTTLVAPSAVPAPAGSGAPMPIAPPPLPPPIVILPPPPVGAVPTAP